ncbi:TPA: protein phosphatase 2C family protein, partial [Streptococcus pneumoniae]
LYYRLPIFAKLSEKKLEYMMLGDCVMLVNEMEITDHRVDNLFEKGKNEIKDSIGTNSVLNKKKLFYKKSENYLINRVGTG